ncbi:MAG: hypothetical protein FWD44_03180 [Oscillospiraceae bacterium]|nr:hypothetical protein [Oscillospiraceae bacterium]
MDFNSNRISHAYITDGETAQELAIAALCSGQGENKPCRTCQNCDKAARGIHPDIITISRYDEKREILIDQIREIKKDVYIKPNEAEKKVYIISDADTMNQNAQNAFLQMLEEPPAHAVFILKTQNPAALLPTVRSRCVDLKTKTQEQQGAEDLSELKALAADYIKAMDDNLLLTKMMFRLEKLNRLEFSSFITQTKEQVVSSLRKDPYNKKLVTADDVLAKANEMLNLNVSAGHVSGFICASFIE